MPGNLQKKDIFISVLWLIRKMTIQFVCLWRTRGKVFPKNARKKYSTVFIKSILSSRVRVGTLYLQNDCRTSAREYFCCIGSRKRQPFYRYITTRKTAGGSLMSSVFLWGNTRMLLKKLIEERDIIKSQR